MQEFNIESAVIILLELYSVLVCIGLAWARLMFLLNPIGLGVAHKCHRQTEPLKVPAFTKNLLNEYTPVTTVRTLLVHY